MVLKFTWFHNVISVKNWPCFTHAALGHDHKKNPFPQPPDGLNCWGQGGHFEQFLIHFAHNVLFPPQTNGFLFHGRSTFTQSRLSKKIFPNKYSFSSISLLKKCSGKKSAIRFKFCYLAHLDWDVGGWNIDIVAFKKT